MHALHAPHSPHIGPGFSRLVISLVAALLLVFFGFAALGRFTVASNSGTNTGGLKIITTVMARHHAR
ncbi:MAG TPA: hypothetical protein VIG32_05270 [Candidatus Baltobacteraceae bacterium]